MNRNVFKILLKTAHYIIKKMMSNQTYPSLIKLISKCGSDALKMFIIKSPKNATYTTQKTFTQILKVLNNFTEEPLLKSIEESKYLTLFHDETTDISNHSEVAVFAMFWHDGDFKEHYVGIIHMSEGGMTAEKHYIATLEFCKKKRLDLSKVQFVDLDGCSTNAGDMQGFKLYFRYHNPHNLHQSCNSHTLALIPKHLITDSKYKAVSHADHLMISLNVLFKNSSVRVDIFEKSQLILEEKVLKLISPSATRWLSHEHCFSRIMEVFEATLITLGQLYEERDDVEALGLLIQLADPKFVLTSLMLVDMLRAIKPLTLWLQSSPALVDATQLPVIVARVVAKLKYISGAVATERSNFTQGELNLQFNKDVFKNKCAMIKNAIESLPAASRLRNNVQEESLDEQFEEFKTSIQQPFVSEIAEEINTNIQLDPVSAAFHCLDVRHFPKVKKDLATHGIVSFEVLSDHFGEPMEAKHPQTWVRNRCDPKINKNEALQEYEIFKTCSFDVNCERSAEIKHKIRMLKKKLGTLLTVASNKSKIKAIKLEIEELESNINNMSLSEVYEVLSAPGRAFLFPNILVLLEMAILCPVGNAVVERIFSLLKIVKTRLRNSLGDTTLDSLLRIKTESKEELEESDLEELVDMFREYLVELSKSGTIRIDI